MSKQMYLVSLMWELVIGTTESPLWAEVIPSRDEAGEE